MSYLDILARALIVASIAWAVFLLFPGLDLGTSGLFYAGGNEFPFRRLPIGEFLDRYRDVLGWTLAGLVLVAQMAVNLWRERRLGLDRFALLFIVLSFAIGPGLIVNGVLKELWGRARPIQIEAFGGAQAYSPPLEIADECASNCSFVSGDASFAFTFLAFAMLTRRRRPLYVGAALGFGAAVGLIRIMKGAHFLSDIVFAAIICITVVLLLHRFIVVDRLRPGRNRTIQGEPAAVRPSPG